MGNFKLESYVIDFGFEYIILASETERVETELRRLREVQVKVMIVT